MFPVRQTYVRFVLKTLPTLKTHQSLANKMFRTPKGRPDVIERARKTPDAYQILDSGRAAAIS